MPRHLVYNIFEHLFTSSHINERNGNIFSGVPIIFIHIRGLLEEVFHSLHRGGRADNLCAASKRGNPRIEGRADIYSGTDCEIIAAVGYHQDFPPESVYHAVSQGIQEPHFDIIDLSCLKHIKHFDLPANIFTLVDYAKDIVSIGNQTGEGWFLTGEMLELIHSGTPNIVCTQPFGCLPNHIVGKGVIKELRRQYPSSNIVAIDYDPGASEVNQLNRIKLMLSTAFKNLNQENK